ncbi:aminomethyl-transferring glycine dehydrogenase subunit GcvPA [Clostridium sp. Cult2]|uniref:aminomethyl-transferring glycine dehydrogenase subunit GcvPA n=1 Tax=Clostridium sp. Cult2 TaxID=2079003 RepID=UPI0030139BC7|nr:aminomethyl-transferring glycine dehydrogenase [Clostridium sp. Cult2]
MDKIVYPYIPNSAPEVKKQMLKELGLEDVEDIYAEIPEHLRFKGKMDLPEPLLSEYELERHVEEILAQDKDCKEYLSFLGGGTWQHYVPEVCNTINSRDEFLTAYVGAAYADHGKYQAMFEFASMLGELLDFDVVSTPTYDWGMAAGYAIRMAARMTGRNEVLIPKTIAPDRYLCIKNLCKPTINIKLIDYDMESGLLDLEDLKNKISDNTAAVYFENPSYLGFIETQVEEISRITHEKDAISIVGVDPSSLGVLAPPSHYGADIACGELQPLGIHMNAGGGLAGFIASRDEEKHVAEYPTQLWGITETTKEGEYGFGDVSFERTSYASRENAKDFLGTQTALWGITAGVYLALMGPWGMQELGEGIMQRVSYAQRILSEIPGVKVPIFSSINFKEFIINFDDTGKKVSEINKSLLDYGIFGGKDLSKEFPELGNSALYCITEIHTKSDIDRLADTLKKVLA